MLPGACVDRGPLLGSGAGAHLPEKQPQCFTPWSFALPSVAYSGVRTLRTSHNVPHHGLFALPSVAHLVVQLALDQRYYEIGVQAQLVNPGKVVGTAAWPLRSVFGFATP